MKNLNYLRNILTIFIILLSLTVFSQIEGESDTVFRRANEIHIYVSKFNQKEALKDYCNYLEDNDLFMVIKCDSLHANSKIFNVNFQYRNNGYVDIPSHIFIDVEVVNSEVVLKINGIVKEKNISKMPMEYFSEEKDKYAKGLLFKYMIAFAENYKYSDKIRYYRNKKL